jgi:hypothetical protein
VDGGMKNVPDCCDGFRAILRSAHDVGDFSEARRRGVGNIPGCTERIGMKWQQSQSLRMCILTVPIVMELAYAVAFFTDSLALGIVLLCMPFAVAFVIGFTCGHLDGLSKKGGGGSREGASASHVDGDTGDAENAASDVDALMGGEQWCAHCKRVRRPFEMHCTTCGGCVPGQDHHCGLLCVCIGDTNRAAFISFLCISLAGSVLQLAHVLRWAFEKNLPATFADAASVVVWLWPFVMTPFCPLMFLVQQLSYLAYRRGLISRPL